MLYEWRTAYPLTERGWFISRRAIRREVELMGQKRWEKILRFAVRLVLAALLLIYIAPKAC